LRNSKIIKKITLFLFLFSVLAPAGLSQNILSEQSNIKSLLSPEGKVLYGNEPNSILVIDYPENINRIEEYLKMVDIPPQQVLIEARIVEVRLEGEHALGINWSVFAENGGLTLGEFQVGSTYPGSPGDIEQNIDYKYTYYPPGTTTTQEEPFTIAILNEHMNAVLRMLSNTLDTNILSAPRITTINNRAAEIKIIESIPWAEPSVTVSETGVTTITWTSHFEEVGIVLRVVPTITEDGQISLLLQPEVSEQTGNFELTVTQGSSQIPYTIPIIDKRSVGTKVVVGNKQTLVIGGLIKETNTKGVTKVPILGDIPLLGWFFKSKKETKEKKELLIFVSPTIITPQVMARMEKEERLGIGKWYMKERVEREKAILEIEGEEKERVISHISDRKKLEELKRKVKDLINKINKINKRSKRRSLY
jgi:type IV pilus secretin PilQ/predicted competence protein